MGIIIYTKVVWFSLFSYCINVSLYPSTTLHVLCVYLELVKAFVFFFLLSLFLKGAPWCSGKTDAL
jgi:hypothetical protein